MEHPVAADVAVGHVFEHGEGLGEFLVSRGPVAEEIAVGRIDVRLVDGDPVADEIAEAVGAELGKGEEIVEIFAFGERAHALEPHGVGEMVDRQQRADAELAQVFQLRAVVRDGGFVDLPALAHDPGPLDAETGDGQVQTGHERAVLAPAVPVVVGDGGVGAVLDPALVIPVVPIAADLSALDLRRGGADAKQKALREL